MNLGISAVYSAKTNAYANMKHAKKNVGFGNKAGDAVKSPEDKYGTAEKEERIAELEAENAAKDARIAELEAENAEKDKKIKVLEKFKKGYLNHFEKKFFSKKS